MNTIKPITARTMSVMTVDDMISGVLEKVCESNLSYRIFPLKFLLQVIENIIMHREERNSYQGIRTFVNKRLLGFFFDMRGHALLLVSGWEIQTDESGNHYRHPGIPLSGLETCRAKDRA
jgi:hypothetical protein